MSNSISEFQAVLFERNLAKPYNFEVQIVTPPKMLGGDLADMSLLSFQAQSTRLPGRSIVGSDIRTYGPTRWQPYLATYNEWIVVFRCSEDMKERKIIREWMDLIENPITHDMGWYNDYATEVRISQINPSADPNSVDKYAMTFVLEHAFPVSVEDVAVSHVPSIEPITMSVSFRYHKWREETKK